MLSFMRVSGVRRSCDTAARKRSRASICARILSCMRLNTRLARRASRGPRSSIGGLLRLSPSFSAADASCWIGRASMRAPYHAATVTAMNWMSRPISMPFRGDGGGGRRSPSGGCARSGRSALDWGAGRSADGPPGARLMNTAKTRMWLARTASTTSPNSRPNTVSGMKRFTGKPRRRTGSPRRVRSSADVAAADLPAVSAAGAIRAGRCCGQRLQQHGPGRRRATGPD